MTFATLPAATIAARRSTGPELIVADGLCPSIAELLPGALHAIERLGLSADPLQAIAEHLSLRRAAGQPIETLHLVAHGRPGAFKWAGSGSTPRPWSHMPTS